MTEIPAQTRSLSGSEPYRFTSFLGLAYYSSEQQSTSWQGFASRLPRSFRDGLHATVLEAVST